MMLLSLSLDLKLLSNTIILNITFKKGGEKEMREGREEKGREGKGREEEKEKKKRRGKGRNRRSKGVE